MLTDPEIAYWLDVLFSGRKLNNPDRQNRALAALERGGVKITSIGENGDSSEVSRRSAAWRVKGLYAPHCRSPPASRVDG